MVAEITWLIYSINLHPVYNLAFLICTWCKNHMLLRLFAIVTVTSDAFCDGIFLRLQSERLKHTKGKETQWLAIEELKQITLCISSFPENIPEPDLPDFFERRVSLCSPGWPWTYGCLPASASNVFGLQICVITNGFNWLSQHEF